MNPNDKKENREKKHSNYFNGNVVSLDFEKELNYAGQFYELANGT